jgi:ATP-dependent DNA helicase RecG
MAGLEESLRVTLGGKAAAKLDTAFGLTTTGDLLRHYPRRYARRGELTDLASLRDGDHVTVFAQVEKVRARPMRARRGQLLEVTVTDGRARLALTFFNKVQFWERQLTPGRHGMFAGKVSTFKGQRQLAHPEFKLLGADDAAKAAEFAAELIPVYPATKDVSTWDIEKCVHIVLDTLGEVADPLPEALRERHRLVGLADALRGVHRPADEAQARAARVRLKWDEALVLQAVLAQRRLAAAALPATARPASAGGLAGAFDARLPFSLTAGQRDVGAVISADLAREHPMHRLLQGEVGSGKTVIAVRAMLQVIYAGGQAALLAEQVQFADLGLVVVDEQHRFGVEQRDALRGKAQGARPHVLVMTATPIPRTVAMTVYGDLDVSTLAELPGGRSPIATQVVPAAEKPRFLERAWERVREEAEKGRQAYVVCPRIGGDDGASPAAPADFDALIGPDDEDEAPARPPLAVLDVAPALEQGPLAGLRLRVMHGRLPTDDKDSAMRAFADGSADVLVSTTVVEVGVDVPNATVMVIMDADRFGVSQLHQLRGRVGRGTEPGLCLLVTEAPEGSKARQRLADVAATLDGFRLAEIDLEQRREGDVLGATQAGRKKSLKLLSVLHDRDLIVTAREEATALVDADPDLTGYPALAAEMSALLDEEQAGFLEKT